MKKFLFILFIPSTSILSSCDFLFGTKQDATTDEIFDEGAIDPNLSPDQVGYVPIQPFWYGFSNPVDICVGYDEMVYVVDDLGVHVLDQTGAEHRLISIPGATDVNQDRQLHVYVSARVDYDIDGDNVKENLAAVYHLMNTSSADQVIFVDTLIHPLCDLSRTNTAYRPSDDPLVQFTGLAILSDNSVYVSRTGPKNDLSSTARPDNTILFFDENGINTGYANGLNPVSSSLKSTLGISAIAGFASPPQILNGMSNSPEFLLLQNDPAAEYGALWIKQFYDPDVGVVYLENSELTIFDYTKADRFLYEPNRFLNPQDIFIAPDFTGYIFVVDAGKDSLYQFTQKGYEGVNPPANSNQTKQIIASFGGAGIGPFNFNEPSGVCYFRKMVYVADKGNNRICRYKLSTDLE